MSFIGRIISRLLNFILTKLYDMKTTFYLSLALFCVFFLFISCNQEVGYRINGDLTGFKDGTVIYLFDLNTEKTIDSCEIKNNSFEFKGFFSNTPALLWLQTEVNNKSIYTVLLIGNENVSVQGDIKDFPFDVKIAGSKTQDEYNELRDLTKKYDKKRDSLVSKFFELAALKKENEANYLMNMPIKVIDSIVQNITISYIKTHKKSINSLINLNNLKEQIPYDSIKKLYSNLDVEIKNSEYAKTIELYLKTKTVDVGDKFFDFTAINQKSEDVKLSNFLNKHILLEFTGAYCVPCILAIDELKIINKKFSDSLVIVSYNTDKAKDVWQASLQRDKINWQSLWDGNGLEGKTCLTYKINGVPTFFLINPKGIIIHKINGYCKGMLEQELKRFIAL